ncbi:MAG: sigma-70 family RNA polymerase sigma factor [Pseudomonadota bacterium]
MTTGLRDEIAVLVPRLRRFAYALTGSREEGDDLVQSACVKALDRIDQFEPGTRLDSWLFTIVRNLFLDDRRRVARRGFHAGDEVLDQLSDQGLAVGQSESRLRLARVRQAMALLPDEQREVIALVAIEGHSYREAAEILSLPVGTVMSRLARGRTRLLALEGEVRP